MINSTQSPTNLTQNIYQYLWNEIAHLHLLPGEKLSEVKLAKEFDCSRVPVREASTFLWQTTHWRPAHSVGVL